MGDGGAGGAGNLTSRESVPIELLEWLRSVNPTLADDAPPVGEAARPFWARVRAWLGSSSTEVPAAVLGSVIAALLAD